MGTASTDPLERLEAIARPRGRRRAQPAHAGDRQPVRDHGLRPAQEPRRLRPARPLRGPRGRHRGPGPRHRAVPRGGRRRATTSWSRSAATARSTRPPTGWSAPRRRCPACPAVAPTSTAGCSASRPTSSTPPSTCSAWPTTGIRGRSTSAWSTSATSCSRPASGLDASVVERVDAHPRLKARLGEWYYAWTGVRTFNRRYLLHPPRLQADLGDERVDGVTAIVQSASPVHLLRQPPGPHGRGRDAGERRPGRRRARARQPDRHPHDHLARALAAGAAGAPPARASVQRAHRPDASARSTTAPLPLQVDGDYIGEVHEARFESCPRAMLVVA